MRRGALAWVTLAFFTFLAGGAVVAVNSPDWAATVDHAVTAWQATPTPQPPTPTRAAVTLAATRGGESGAVRWLVGGLLTAAALLALTGWLVKRATSTPTPPVTPSPAAAREAATAPTVEAEVIGFLRWA